MSEAEDAAGNGSSTAETFVPPRSLQRERAKEETALGKRKSFKAVKGDEDPFGDDDDDDDLVDAKKLKTGGLFAAEVPEPRG